MPNTTDPTDTPPRHYVEDLDGAQVGPDASTYAEACAVAIARARESGDTHYVCHPTEDAIEVPGPVAALCTHLGIEDPADVEAMSYDPDVYDADGAEYLVVEGYRADQRARADILGSVWAFRAEFLAAHCVEGVDADTIRAIQDNGRCEGNNAVLTRLIENVDHFVADAIGADGRGHFLSSYDGEEHQIGRWFIYRVN